MTAHPLAGAFSVEASSALVRHYRYVEERMMRILGGWIALTPELPAKLLFGRHVWDCAQHADLWGRRLPELRAPAHQSMPANQHVVELFETIASAEAPGATAERLTAIHRVVKPHLAAVYARHLAAANAVYEPPTRRILVRCLDEERRHAAAGAAVFGAIVTDAAARSRAERWEGRLREILRRAGGVTGRDSDLAEEARVAEHPEAAGDVVALGTTFALPALPAGLDAALDAHVRAARAGDGAAIAAQATEDVAASLAEIYEALGRVADASLVAVAEIGAMRLVKLRVAAAASTAIVQLAWRPDDDGRWRITRAGIVRSEPLAASGR